MIGNDVEIVRQSDFANMIPVRALVTQLIRWLCQEKGDAFRVLQSVTRLTVGWVLSADKNETQTTKIIREIAQVGDRVSCSVFPLLWGHVLSRLDMAGISVNCCD